MIKLLTIGIEWIVCAALVLAPSAFAQSVENKGLRLGKFRLSPSFRFSTGVNTNPLYSDSNPEADMVFNLVPGIHLFASSPKTDFQTGYAYTLQQYLNNEIQNSDGHAAHIELDLKSYRWKLELRDEYVMTTDPADEEILERVEHTDNKATAQFSYFAPSRNLEFKLGYTNFIRDFDNELQSLSNFNNLLMVSSMFNISSLVRFLPKTFFTFNVEYADYRYPEADPNTRSEGKGFTINAGLNGKVTSKLSLQLELGMKWLDFDVDPDTHDLSGRIALEYKRHLCAMHLAYVNTTQVSTFTNFYDANAFDLGFTLNNHNQRLILEGKAEIDFLDYSEPTTIFPGETRKDTVLRNSLKLTYKFLTKMNLFTEYAYNQRLSNAVSQTDGSSSADFDQHIWMGGFQLRY